MSEASAKEELYGSIGARRQSASNIAPSSMLVASLLFAANIALSQLAALRLDALYVNS